MYEYISGKLIEKEATFAIIEAAGIGYHFKISLQTSSSIGEDEFCKLFVYLHVRETEQTLYGFVDREERKLFLLLISISGIGPNTGLMMLSSLSTKEIKNAIMEGNAKLIQSVKGIGVKTAQRVILELKDKIQKTELPDSSSLETHESVDLNHRRKHHQQEAIQALIMLGFHKPVAEKSLDKVLKKYGESLSIEEMIRLALKTN